MSSSKIIGITIIVVSVIVLMVGLAWLESAVKKPSMSANVATENRKSNDNYSRRFSANVARRETSSSTNGGGCPSCML